jgi:hypothetical protein
MSALEGRPPSAPVAAVGSDSWPQSDSSRNVHSARSAFQRMSRRLLYSLPRKRAVTVVGIDLPVDVAWCPCDLYGCPSRAASTRLLGGNRS